MAEAGLFARQDAELRANLSQLAKRFEPVRAEHMDVRAKSSHPDQFFPHQINFLQYSLVGHCLFAGPVYGSFVGNFPDPHLFSSKMLIS